MAPAASVARVRKQMFDRVEAKEVTVREACRSTASAHRGFSELRQRYRAYGEAGLLPKPRPTVRLSRRVSPALVDAIVGYAVEHPTHGATRPRATDSDKPAAPGPLPVAGDGVADLQCRQARERARHLERPPQPAMGDAVRGQAVDAPVAEHHLAGVGSDHAGDEVEERRLAGTRTVRPMPVLVTGAERALGAATVAALAASGGQVRAYLDPLRATPAVLAGLRAHGAVVARGAPDDEGRLELALAQVHTVVHAAVEPLAAPAAALDGVATTLSAAIGAGCRRLVVVLPFAGHDPDGNPYLEAVAEVEQLLADAPLETVALRCALPYGSGDPLVLALAGGAAAAYPGLADARHAPVLAEDLAAATAAADRQRGAAGDLALVLRLAGPETVSLGDFGRLLGAPAGRLRARLGWLRGDVPVLSDHVVDLLARGEPPGPATCTPTGVRAGVARLRAEVYASP